jgi:DNA replicative helicase MCM subunit Mcm2 (Cdc46/Mcm family)
MKIAAKIVPVGNGFGVEIPQSFMESCGLKEGNVITLDLKKTVVLSANFAVREESDFGDERFDIDRIMRDHPKTDRDKIYVIEQIVKAICLEREDKLAPIEEIMRRAVNSKIDDAVTGKILNELKIKGILFEPKNGKWKWVG